MQINIKMIEVESSNIKAIGYDKPTRALYVKFLNDTNYVYANVDENIYNELMKAESHGKYLNSNIKGKFDYTKI